MEKFRHEMQQTLGVLKWWIIERLSNEHQAFREKHPSRNIGWVNSEQETGLSQSHYLLVLQQFFSNFLGLLLN